MCTSIGKLTGRMLLAMAAIGVVFVIGLRRKRSFVLNPVRRLGRATKPFVLKSSGTLAGLHQWSATSVGQAAGRTKRR